MRVFQKFDKNILQVKHQYQFSITAKDTLNESFSKFNERFSQHTQQFKEKMEKLQSDNKIQFEKPTGTPFHHPYNNEHHPLNFSSVKNAELFYDMVGPEQVSPHYENFMMARKWALFFWGGLGLISFGISTVDLHWIAKSSLIPFIFWMQLFYFYLEGRKSIFKPLLTRFYRKIAANDCHNFDVYYHENIENKVRDLMRVSKQQLEYYQIHQQFKSIKAESINNFLANEQLNLKQNIHDRALNVLQQSVSFEKLNKSKFLQKIIDDAVADLDKALEGKEKAQIQKQILDSAIEGLAKGYMDYPNDPILPIVHNSIKIAVSQINSMNDEQQLKLISLTEHQLKLIKDDDQRIKNEFLNAQPTIDSSLKANENVKKIMAQWGAGHH